MLGSLSRKAGRALIEYWIRECVHHEALVNGGVQAFLHVSDVLLYSDYGDSGSRSGQLAILHSKAVFSVIEISDSI